MSNSSARGSRRVGDSSARDSWQAGDSSAGEGQQVRDSMERTVEVAELVCLLVERVDSQFNKYKGQQCRHTYQVHCTPHNHFLYLSFLIFHCTSFILAFSIFKIAPHEDL